MSLYYSCRCRLPALDAGGRKRSLLMLYIVRLYKWNIYFDLLVL